MGEKYHKLVRDKIPDILDRKGISYEKHIADDREYKAWLLRKLQEEIDEFLHDESTEEFADVLEVIETIKSLSDYVDVEDVRMKKNTEKGGFSKRFILKGEK